MTGRGPAWWPAEGDRPDYRFSLANERTLLAWTPLPPPLLAVRMATAVALGALIGGPVVGLAVFFSSR